MSSLEPVEFEFDQLPAPLFELPAAVAFDLSAIISALILAFDVSDAGLSVIASDYLHKGLGLYVIGVSYLAFISTVLLLQYKLRLSPLAKSFGKAQTLTTHGIYQYTRNPIYLSFLVPLVSVAYFSILAAATSITLYIVVMNLTVIRKEERELQAAFGAQYTAYRKAVPRWIG
jgi:protein-S-isoprenylcysteine O-methyltransferase Ste14